MICDQSFNETDAVRSHFISKHSKSSWKCDTCGLRNSCERSVRRHKQLHKNEVVRHTFTLYERE